MCPIAIVLGNRLNLHCVVCWGWIHLLIVDILLTETVSEYRVDFRYYPNDDQEDNDKEDDITYDDWIRKGKG